MDIEEVLGNTVDINESANHNANGDVINDIDDTEEESMKPGIFKMFKLQIFSMKFVFV